MGIAFDTVVAARKVDRPSALDFFEGVFESFIEFHGDRNFRDDGSVVGGIALIGEIPVTVIGIQKGANLEENLKRNFGSPHPEGYRKALRLMKQAEKFKRPVVCFINTAGAYCGRGAEERGQGEAIARNLIEMSKLEVPIISILIGEGGSGGALALAVADEVWMLENSIYSILSPEGFASILWKDASRAAEAAELMKITASELQKLGVIDKIIYENKYTLSESVVKPFPELCMDIKFKLTDTLEKLINTDIEDVLENRYQRFRKF